MRSPAGGEIGEAPPVADEASRFRGSAPIGGYDSARQSVGTTVGKRAPPLRTTRYASVGADAYIGPPYRTSCKNLSLRGQFANWLWQSASPVPSVPLPKGDCRGEAVTGGFFTSPHLLQLFRRGDPCGRPREGQSPSPTHHKIRFRRGRRLPTVVPTDFRSLSCPPIGALPRNRLASSATGSASPISPTARPEFFPHPRQGTRALPYKVLRYRARTPLSTRSLK